jgi:hypothetical protein
MTTIFTATPTFEERLIASTLVVVGRVLNVVDVSVDSRDERPQVRTTFRVAVESVLKGRLDQREILVQVAGGRSAEVETPWSAPLQEGNQFVLMLAPNYAYKAVDQFVPYFSSAFVLREGGVDLHDEVVAKQLVQQGVRVEGTVAQLSDLQRLVEAVENRQREHEARLFELEPTELREAAPAEITELPPVSGGAPRAAEPEPAPQEPAELG